MEGIYGQLNLFFSEINNICKYMYENISCIKNEIDVPVYIRNFYKMIKDVIVIRF